MPVRELRAQWVCPDVLAWRRDAVEVIELPGDHLLPLRIRTL
jgi:hypothetical protein